MTKNIQKIFITLTFFCVFAGVLYKRNNKEQTEFERFLQSTNWKEEFCVGFLSEGTATIQVNGNDVEIKTEELATSEEKDSAQTQRDQYSDAERASKFEAIITGEDPVDYLIIIVQKVGIWMFFFIFSYFDCIYLSSCCCCDCCCPPLKCCRKKYENGLKKLDFLLPGIITGVSMLALLITSILGLVFASKLVENFEKTQCSIFAFVQEVKDGAELGDNLRYFGLEGAKDPLEGLKGTMDKIQVGSTELGNNPTLAETKNNIIKNDIKALDDNIDTSPQYLKDGIGPHTQPGTTSYLLLEQAKVLDGIIKDYKELETTTKDFATQAGSTKQSLSDAQSSLTDATKNLDDAIDNLVDPFDQGKTYLGYAQQGYNAIMAIGLIFSLVMVLGIGLAHFINTKGRFLIHISWWLLSFFMIFGFLISFVLGFVSYIFLDFCTWFDEMLNNKEKLDSIDGLVADVKEKLNVCLYGDGDLLENLGVTEATKEFDDVLQSTSKALESNQNSSQQTKKMEDLFVQEKDRADKGLASDSTKQDDIVGKIKAIETKNIELVNLMENSSAATDLIGKVEEDLEKYLHSNDEGLLKNMNCRFVSVNIRRISDGVCSLFVPTIVNSYGTLAAFSFISLFSSCWAFCLGFRYSKKDEYYNKIGQNSNGGDYKEPAKPQ